MKKSQAKAESMLKAESKPKAVADREMN